MIYLTCLAVVVVYGLLAGASYAAAVALGGDDSPPLAAALWPIALPAMGGYWLAHRLLRRAEPPIPVARIARDRGAGS